MICQKCKEFQHAADQRLLNAFRQRDYERKRADKANKIIELIKIENQYVQEEVLKLNQAIENLREQIVPEQKKMLYCVWARLARFWGK